MKTKKSMFFAWILCLFLVGGNAVAQGKNEFSLKPTSNNGVPWRIGYFEGGAYANYYNYLYATVQGLMDLGWIPEAELPRVKDKRTGELWSWLCGNAGSPYIEFVEDAFYSANWDSEARPIVARKLIGRLNEKEDVDLVIAMGTWAGKDLANDSHRTPTVIMSTSDPVGSGIITSVDDSGYDYVHARVDPYRYERQIRIFHDLVGFKKLGVAYENSPDGRVYSAIDLIKKVAKERSFEIVPCFTQSDIANQQIAGESVIRCFRELAASVDAIYVTRQGGVNADTISELVAIAHRHRIPTFSQSGSKEVRNGLLMSISSAGGFQPAGRYFAATIGQIFNGAKPRQLSQLFEESPKIAINLVTAEIIGFYLRADLLAAADEIYREIEKPN